MANFNTKYEHKIQSHNRHEIVNIKINKLIV